jgi:hypothetical protein
MVAHYTAQYSTRDSADSTSLAFYFYNLHICDRTALIASCLNYLAKISGGEQDGNEYRDLS